MMRRRCSPSWVVLSAVIATKDLGNERKEKKIEQKEKNKDEGARHHGWFCPR